MSVNTQLVSFRLIKEIGVLTFLICFFTVTGKATCGFHPIKQIQEVYPQELSLFRLELKGKRLEDIKNFAENPKQIIEELLTYYKKRTSAKQAIEKDFKEILTAIMQMKNENKSFVQ